MKFKTLGVASSLAIIACLSTPAMAQDDEEDSGSGRNTTIVVTAEFREAALQDTPIAITAVNAEMLEARGQTNISDVAAQAPNVSLRPQPQNGGSGLIAFIRGVGQTDFNFALDPGVGVYIDDVYIPTLSSSLLELVDLERVEVLRGPQGTLAGKNSIGGAIKLFSAKPRGDNSGSFRVEYGSFNSLGVRGMADFAITDSLAMRVSGMTRSNDGYVAMLDYGLTHPDSNVNVGNLSRGFDSSDYESMGGQNVTAIRGALRWESESVEINLSGDYTRENSEARPTVLRAAGPICATSQGCTEFLPDQPGLAFALDGNGVPPSYTNPLLVGKDGSAVPISCAFVPAGPWSCDTGGNLLGYDPRFVSYSTFMDAAAPTDQAPFKPFFALPITEFEGWGVHGNVTVDLSDDLQLVYIGSYRTYESKFGQDQDASPVPVAQLDNKLDHWAFTSEVRLNFEAAEGLVQGTVGAFYLEQEGIYNARVDLNYVAPATIDFLHGPDETPSNTKAAFATVTVSPTDNFSLTGGLRYTKDKKDYTYFRRNPDGSVPPAFPPDDPNACQLFSEPNCLLAGIFGVTETFEGDRWDWRIVGDYRFSDEFLMYASVSTGFKGGGVNPRPFVADQAIAFNPETLTTYEVGFKADLADRMVRLNGAAFLNKYNDITLGKLVCPESVLATPCLRPANIGSADVKGVELEASIFPVDGVTIDASFSYLDFEYTSPSALCTDPTLCGYSTGETVLDGTAIPVGAITPYTTELTYSFGIQYDHDTDMGTFSARVDGAYQGEMFTTAENTFFSKIDDRFLGNARISWTDTEDDWRVSLEVKNIFDKYYFESVSDVTTSLGVATGVPGLPRTWAVSVAKNF